MMFKARDPCAFSVYGGFGEIPKPTVKVWMGEGGSVKKKEYFNAYFAMNLKGPAFLRGFSIGNSLLHKIHVGQGRIIILLASF